MTTTSRDFELNLPTYHSAEVKTVDKACPEGSLVECLLPMVVGGAGMQSLTRTFPRPYEICIDDYVDDQAERAQEQNEEGSVVHTLPMSEHPSILQAQSECQSLQNGNCVEVFEDEDVQEDIVQILGHTAQLVFPCRNAYRYLVLFVKYLQLYFEFQVEILDDKQQYRRLKATNSRSLARVENSNCQLPLVFGKEKSWRYVCLDLQDLTTRAFGTKHVTTTKLRIGSNCRLLRVFFQDEMYHDYELPLHVTFLGA